jgi:Arc/MetJ-type ribon-helix-helix transcriptional regulator
MMRKQERDSVSIRLSPDLSRSLSQALAEGGYITASEFVREAIRDKLRKMQEED